MRILFASSEVAPFAKTGGLADVAGALPKALKALGHDIRVVLAEVSRWWTPDSTDCGESCPTFPVPIAGTVETGAVWEGPIGAVPTYFIEQDDYYDREGLYQVAGEDHPDNCRRFAFFSRAVLELARAARLFANRLPLQRLADRSRPDLSSHHLSGRPRISATPVSLFTVHNLGYHGLFNPAALVDRQPRSESSSPPSVSSSTARSTS